MFLQFCFTGKLEISRSNNKNLVKYMMVYIHETKFCMRIEKHFSRGKQNVPDRENVYEAKWRMYPPQPGFKKQQGVWMWGGGRPGFLSLRLCVPILRYQQVWAGPRACMWPPGLLSVSLENEGMDSSLKNNPSQALRGVEYKSTTGQSIPRQGYVILRLRVSGPAWALLSLQGLRRKRSCFEGKNGSCAEW